MSIEDVKQWNDARLNIALSKEMGWTDNGAPAVYYGLIHKYTDDITAAREVQAKAMEVSADRYVSNLDYVVNPDSTIDVWTNDAIVKLLQATPRQIAEAAYLTLKG